MSKNKLSHVTVYTDDHLQEMERRIYLQKYVPRAHKTVYPNDVVYRPVTLWISLPKYMNIRDRAISRESIRFLYSKVNETVRASAYRDVSRIRNLTTRRCYKITTRRRQIARSEHKNIAERSPIMMSPIIYTKYYRSYSMSPLHVNYLGSE